MKKSIKKIIKLALQHLDLDSEDARNLIYRTGKAESGYKTLQQYGQDQKQLVAQLKSAYMLLPVLLKFLVQAQCKQ